MRTVSGGGTLARIFVGVAWPYANGPFHLGHLAGAYLPGDIFARYHRLVGDEVLMVSGSDMHGTPILVRAEKEGVSPAAVAERYHAVNAEAFRKLGFSFDLYTHTRTIVHERQVQEMFLVLLQNGYIDRRTEENPYCPKHQRFLPDRYLVGECPHCGFPSARGDECDNCGRVLQPKDLKSPRCSLDGTPAEFRPSEHFYLRLDRLAPEIDEFLLDKGPWRANVRAGFQAFQRAGLRPTPITRDLDWGIPIPLDGYPTKRFYVWFDAVTGYLSASKEWAIRAGRPDAWRRYWDKNERVRAYYFIGKDNIFHHTIVWPAMLLGFGGLQLPYDVPANEWLLIEGHKVSKTRTAGEEPFVASLLERYPPDHIRFYAAALAPQNHDTELDWDEFHQLYDQVLSNQYGNLAQRVLVFVRDRHGGKVPGPPDGWAPDREGTIGPRLKETHARIAREYEAVHLKEAVDLAMAEVREANRRFHEAKPWQADEAAQRRALYEALWFLKAAAVWLSPVLPFSSEALWRMLGYPEGPGGGSWARALEPPEPGQPLGEIRPLFPKRELAKAPTPSVATTGTPATEAGPAPLAILTAVVTDVQNHPSADKLYVLTLDAGEPKARTVVAGMRPYYSPDQLRGRKVAVLANLEPRTIRKVTSQGMVLAADSGDRVELVAPPAQCPPGTPVARTGGPIPQVSYAQFDRAPLLVGRVVASGASDGVRVDIGGREIRAAGPAEPGTPVVVRLFSADGQEGEILTFGPGLYLRPSGDLPAGTRVR